jgi:hypothetical protein
MSMLNCRNTLNVMSAIAVIAGFRKLGCPLNESFGRVCVPANCDPFLHEFQALCGALNQPEIRRKPPALTGQLIQSTKADLGPVAPLRVVE